MYNTISIQFIILKCYPGIYTYRYKNYEYVRTSIKWTLSNWLEDCVQVFTESPYFGYTSGFPKTWLADKLETKFKQWKVPNLFNCSRMNKRFYRFWFYPPVLYWLENFVTSEAQKCMLAWLSSNKNKIKLAYWYISIYQIMIL